MALPEATIFEAFGLRFIRYRFLSEGDELPLHEHDFDHISVVDGGRVEVFGPDRRVEADLEAKPFMFRAGRPHGIRALSPGAIVLNVSLL